MIIQRYYILTDVNNMTRITKLKLLRSNRVSVSPIDPPLHLFACIKRKTYPYDLIGQE